MENVRIVKILFCVGILVVPFLLFAYEPNTTHKGLTRDIVRFFEHHYLYLQFTDEEKEWIELGSVEEDSDIRFLFHFYDPVFKQGLKGNLSSKNWAQSTRAQAGVLNIAGIGVTKDLFSAPSDYSWDRAIYEYVHGDKKRGLVALGHILHLLEDATVPDHTRNDAHPPFFDSTFHQASPYEYWTGENFNADNMTVAWSLIKENKKPIKLDSLGEYFDALALYSNNNFFSKDTIFDEKYEKPNIVFEKSVILSDGRQHVFGYNNINNKLSKLVRIQNKFDKKEGIYKSLFFIEDKDNLVLSDYWHHLSQQAVLNGSGVVKLFFDEVEKERETLALYEKNKSLVSKLAENVKEQAASVLGITLDNTDTTYREKIARVVKEDYDKRVNNLSEIVAAASDNVGIIKKAVANVVTYKTQDKTSTISTWESDSQVEKNEDKTPREEESGEARAENGITHNIPQGYQWKPKATLPFPGFGGGGSASASASTVTEPQAEPEEETAVPHDTTPPDTPTLTISECSQSIANNQNTCLIVGTSLSISWASSTASDFSHYLLDINGTTEHITTTSSQKSGTDKSTSTISLAAYDTSGNGSATTTKTVIHEAMPVVINEVAWAGTNFSAFNEWIELYNRSDHEISLIGWTLASNDNTPNINFSDATTQTISSKGYYLLERTDDTTVNDITEDAIYTGALNDTGETLTLSFASTTIDQTPPTTACGGNWCGGTTYQDKTMERYDTETTGTDSSNWSTALGEFIQNGKDINNIPIKGTPKKKNSISYQIANSSTLSASKTLTKANSPYIVGRNGLTVSNGATLTMEAGTVVKIVTPNEPRVTINGAIVANGTQAEPVAITSFEDDIYGGDMNGDGICDPGNASSTAVCPNAGSWERIQLSGTHDASSFTNTILRYGGRWFTSTHTDYRALVVDNGTNVSFNSVTIEHSGKHGLSLISSDATISSSTIRNNNKDTTSAGLYVSGGSPTITNTIFSSNTIGADVVGSSASFTGNTFTNNTSYAAKHLSLQTSAWSFNTGSGNGKNGIALIGTITTNGVTTTLSKNTLPYFIDGYGGVTVVASSTLSISPGVVVKFKDRNLFVDGTLSLNGTESSPVMFTSFYDDATDGIDTDGGGATTGAAGNSPGTLLRSGSLSTISHAVFKFMNIALEYINSPITLSDVSFEENALGVKADIASQNDHAITVSNVTFTNNTATTSPSGLW